MNEHIIKNENSNIMRLFVLYDKLFNEGIKGKKKIKLQINV